MVSDSVSYGGEAVQAQAPKYQPIARLLASSDKID